MRLDHWPESQPAAPAPADVTADAPLPPMMGAGEGLAASSPESLQPDPGAGEGQPPAEAPPLADSPAPPTADARLTAGIGQPASPDDSADLPPAGAPLPGGRPPLSPADAALDNARRGTWMMSEHFSGWVLLGADSKPVMRNDGSRVAFRFEDAARLADELSAAPDDNGAAGLRRALAPLDSGFNKDWDPQIPKSALADRTKLVKLLAYHYVQTTEPQEAVRRAVSDIFGDPTYIEQPGMKAWVPGKYDAEAVKSVANTLLSRALGPELAGDDSSQEEQVGSPAMPFGQFTRGGVPQDGRNRGADFVQVAAADGAPPADGKDQGAGGDMPKAPPGVDINANIAQALRHRGQDRWFYNQVTNYGPWDYKRQSKDPTEFEDFGNYNYGASGAAMGYSEATLLRMAGWRQVKDNRSRPEWGKAPSLLEAYSGVGGKAPFGDDPKDQDQISKGYWYYHKEYRKPK